jgi:hypothetical protein
MFKFRLKVTNPGLITYNNPAHHVISLSIFGMQNVFESHSHMLSFLGKCEFHRYPSYTLFKTMASDGECCRPGEHAMRTAEFPLSRLLKPLLSHLLQQWQLQS